MSSSVIPRPKTLPPSQRLQNASFLSKRLLLALCLLGLGWGAAQNRLDDYRLAADALEESVAVFPDDRVESLDALRRAEAAFTSLSEGLDPALKQGLSATFSRAEAAIVNRSEADLRVQSAVLRGGFQRILYEQALGQAAGGKLPRARTLLDVLAADLGFAGPVTGTDRQALQTGFEGQLAKVGLAELDALSDAKESRYETLARLYSYTLVVQNSPRLPAEMRADVLGAIGALVADKPLTPSLKTVRAQFTQFRRAAEQAVPPKVTPTLPVVEGASTPALGRVPPKVTPTPVTPATTETKTTGNTRIGSLKGAGTVAATDTPRATRADAPVTKAVDRAQKAQTPPEPADRAFGDASPGAVSTSVEPEGVLGSLRDLRSPLLIAAGLLALVALIGSMRASRGGPTFWQNAALALLLLPALGEGLIALAETLGPRTELPLLSGLGRYSVFTNPVTQLVWPLLTAVAVFCLALSWRAPARAVTDAGPKPKAPTQTPPSAPPPPVPSAPATRPRLVGSGPNWDEDF